MWVEMQEGNALFTIWERLQITGYGNLEPPFWACNFRRGKVLHGRSMKQAHRLPSLAGYPPGVGSPCV